ASPTTQPTATTTATATPTEVPEATPIPIALLDNPSEEILPTETEPKVAESSAMLVIPESQQIKKVYLSNDQTIIDTVSTDWVIDEVNGSAETKEAVKLGVKYVFPLNDKVALTFKSLPANESLRTTIKIVKVKVSDLNLPDDMKPYGEYAYDITTGMGDGIFDYDLTLPKPTNQNVDVAYMEDKNSTPLAITENQTIQQGDVVKASNIDHFTIFVVINPVLTGLSCVLVGATTGTGCYSTVQDAINASVNGDVVEIESDISVGQMIIINKDITINGNGFTISPTFTKTDNSNNAVFGIVSSGVTISNLIVDGTLGTNLHGINLYTSINVLLDNVSVLNNDRAGIVVNGSTVTVNNITTSGNGWGGINVDQGTGVTTEAKLIIDGISSHSESTHIWLDDVSKVVSVDDTNPKQYDYQEIAGTPTVGIYTLKTAGNPSATLSQYANDAPTGWVNGNLGASKATYYEGDSIPYRMVMDNLSLASHSLTIEWDTTKSSKHAEDFLTTFDRSVPSANPCVGVSGCSSFSTFAIPKDPQVDNGSGSPITQIPGDFRLYGGNITGVSAYSYDDGVGFVGDKSARITVTFTASVSNPVLAWGGHIAHRSDWGADNSAIAIPGSPYHMRLIDLDGSGGNQDRSLSADAVIFPASITIVKEATPEGSTSFPFTASPTPLTNFSLIDNGIAANTSTFSGITNFQTYTVTENTPTGWSFDNINCSVTSPNGGGENISGATVTINLKEGENRTCTYTNSLQQANLTLIKTVTKDNGGTAVPTDWTLYASGPDPISGVSGSPAVTGAPINAGTYTLSESGGPTGYTEGSWSCVKNSAAPVIGSSIVIGGRDTVTCTINNNDIAPQLTVIKHVINDNGGTAVAANFTINVTGTDVSNPSFAGSESPGTTVTLDAGGYGVDESPFPGYAKTIGANCSGTIAIGETKTCTITNNDRAPILHLRKTIVNDNGGTATEADFTLSANGTGANDISGNSPVDSGAGLMADTFALSETGPVGYSASDWVCVGGTQNGSNITLGLNQETTCTIINNDIPPSLTLIKQMSNNDGGNNLATDWTLSAAGPKPISGAGGATSGSDFLAGTYILSETGPGGYVAGNWNCTGTGTFSIATVALDPGESETCTIINDDLPAHIILNKIVQNNYGGTLGVNSFGISVGGTVVLSGSNTQVLSNQPYAIDEQLSLASGYEFVSLTGDVLCPAVLGGTVTLNEGQTITCNITNQDIPAHLIVIKHVINDNGGTATASNFTMTINTVTAQGGNSFPGSESPGVNKTLTSVGSYSVTESGPDGYNVGYSANCSGTIALGETKTCTITNNDKAPELHLRKVVVNDNGGTNVAADWTLTATGPTTLSGSTPVDSDNTFDAGAYALSESGPAGYSSSAWTCVGGTQVGSNITIGIDQDVTCTITNDDTAPRLHLRKVVVNDNGGNATLASFTLTADGTGTNDLSGTSPVDSGVTLKADTFALSESSVPGYSASAWTCNGGTQNGSNITLGLNQEATCTIINDDIAPKLTLVKTVINDNGGTKVISNFPLFINGVPATSGVSYDQTANIQLTASETSQTGYTPSVWGGDCAANGTITLLPGDDKTCTITNDDQPGTLIVKKIISGGEAVFGDFSFQVGTDNPIPFEGDGQNDLTVDAGTYTVTEPKFDSYEASYDNCIRVQVANGETEICTITNTWQNPKVTITKSNDKGGGTSAGDTVNYTLVVTNDGNVDIGNLIVTDVLPGGFSYIDNTAYVDGAQHDPDSIVGSTLSWNVGTLNVEDSITITYQVKIDSSVSDGIYTNFASCHQGEQPTFAALLFKPITCEPVNSTVPVGSTLGYGGNLAGQVLGASTELPATGNPTIILVVALGMLGTGLFINRYARKERKMHEK
ncbi:MAG: hypothetical protein ACD_22C00235G0001, partial [uncultured bacterium]